MWVQSLGLEDPLEKGMTTHSSILAWRIPRTEVPGEATEPDVATICTGMAASMGSVLLCAGAKGKRSALPHSRVMIHQPLGGARGQASDILIAAQEIEKTKKELYEIISEHSGQPIERIYADGDRDFWMTSQEALEYGMIDEILRKKNR